MPFKSLKQMRWMFVNKPKLARRWTETYGSKVARAKAVKKG